MRLVPCVPTSLESASGTLDPYFPPPNGASLSSATVREVRLLPISHSSGPPSARDGRELASTSLRVGGLRGPYQKARVRRAHRPGNEPIKRVRVGSGSPSKFVPEGLNLAGNPFPHSLDGVRRCSTPCRPLPPRFVTGGVRTRRTGLSRPTNHGASQYRRGVEAPAMSRPEGLDIDSRHSTPANPGWGVVVFDSSVRIRDACHSLTRRYGGVTRSD
eukprot:4002723-Pleurochrysis_carterae.AAC.1